MNLLRSDLTGAVPGVDPRTLPGHEWTGGSDGAHSPFVALREARPSISDAASRRIPRFAFSSLTTSRATSCSPHS